jgi:hypothetical protein
MQVHERFRPETEEEREQREQIAYSPFHWKVTRERAKTILMLLDGYTDGQIGKHFNGTAEAIRMRRIRFNQVGFAALDDKRGRPSKYPRR